MADLMFVRIEDRELQDPRVAMLTASKYRERAALMQYVAREHHDAGGIFGRAEAPLAVYLTASGPRGVSPKTIERLLELGLLRTVGSYTPGELLELEHGERTNRAVAYSEAASAIREAQAVDESLLRFNHWEFYNGPRDRTASDRMRRHRKNKEAGVTRNETRDATGTATGSARARHPHPQSHPHEFSTQTSTEDVARARADRERLSTGNELEIARLLAALGTVDEATVDTVRGYGARVPEAAIARLRESLDGGRVRDRVAYVIGGLKREASGVSRS